MILVDTGPIVAAAFTTETHYRACVDLFTGLRLAGRRLLLLPTVTAEAGYMINRLGGAQQEAGWLEGIAAGAFELVDLTAGDYRRMAELVGQYADLPLGTTDASLIAVAERLRAAEIATLDRRHFTVVRPRHLDAFRLLPESL